MNDLDLNMNESHGEKDCNGLPVWIRAPKNGALDHHTGLGKGFLSNLAAQGAIKSASLKRKGCSRGVRLFHLRSILDYIENQALHAQVEEKKAGVHNARIGR